MERLTSHSFLGMPREIDPKVVNLAEFLFFNNIPNVPPTTLAAS